MRTLLRQCDPFIRLFAWVFFVVLFWRLGVAILALPSMNLNMRDYIWITMFFGMSDLLYLALAFTSFGIIRGLTIAILFASVTSYITWVCAGVPVRRFRLILGCATAACLAISNVIGPPLHSSLANLTGASAIGWIAIIGEFLLGVIIIQAMASRQMKDWRRRQKRKPA